MSRPRSGHVYLNLKDDAAQIRAVMWKADARRLAFDLEDGTAVRAWGRLSVYAPRGEYQVILHAIEPEGIGALELAFRQVFERLKAEGLFDPERKRPLPRFPRRIAVVTSPTGAAIHDFIRVAKRRWPAVEILVAPTRVQGPGAAAEVAAAIALANSVAGVDLIVVARGGGSLEDLWAFNEEAVARAIAAARRPVVSAVGHEVDVTIADCVADLRASTPSVAGELCVPDARGPPPVPGRPGRAAGPRRRLADRRGPRRVGLAVRPRPPRRASRPGPPPRPPGPRRGGAGGPQPPGRPVPRLQPDDPGRHPRLARPLGLHAVSRRPDPDPPRPGLGRQPGRGRRGRGRRPMNPEPTPRRPDAMGSEPEPDFEDALRRLERIVDDLERGDSDLAAALKGYEEGVRLLAQCHGLLDGAEKAVAVLTGVEADGTPRVEPLGAAEAVAEPPASPAKGRKPKPTEADLDGLPF